MEKIPLFCSLFVKEPEGSPLEGEGKCFPPSRGGLMFLPSFAIIPKPCHSSRFAGHYVQLVTSALISRGPSTAPEYRMLGKVTLFSFLSAVSPP